MYDGKNILITGSNGIFGYALCKDLLEKFEGGEKFKVECLTRREPPPHFDKFRANPAFSFTKCDLSFGEIELAQPPDLIFHFACYGRPQAFMSDPISTINLNVNCTRALLEWVKQTKGQMFFASTSEVYGDPDVFPTPESYPGNSLVTHPRACYIESKRMGEVLCLEYNRLYGLNNKIGRIALTFGEGAEYVDERVMYSFMRQAVENWKVECKDSGKAERTYLYVADAIDIISDILRGKESIYNVGGRETITIRTLANMIADQFGVPCIVPENADPFMKAPGRVLLDMSRYDSEFGEPSQWDFRSALECTTDWFKEQYVY
jgi:UDP-glucuronate decarboxylase